MNVIPVWTFAFVLIFVTYDEAFGESCSTTYKAIGCYKDFRHKRSLPHLIMNKRGNILWKNYTDELSRLVCSCASKAKEMGFGYFGIQYYGECWADKIFTFPKKKKSCIDGEYKKCNKTGSNRTCTGKMWTNFVYEVTTVKPVKYKQIAAGPTKAKPTKAGPTTAKPITAGPTTAGPTTAKPTTAKPTTAKPTTAGPTTAGPTTAKPTTAKPTTAKPTTAGPTTAGPTTAKPTTAGPTTAGPTKTGPTTVATTAEPTKAKITIKCKVPLDIAFVVDASGSVGVQSFQLVKSFLKEFTHYFNVSANETHFACLHYDHKVHPDFSFNETQFYNPAALNVKLDNMTYPSGATLTDRALWAAKKFYRKDHGARDYHVIPRCLVVLTDGTTYGGKYRLVPPVQSLKNAAHVKIVAIGVTWQVDEDELKIMAGDRHYVLVDRFEHLADAMGEVLDKVCT